MNTLAIVVACGKEEEIASGTDTAFLPLGQIPILALTLRAIHRASSIDSIILAVAKNRAEISVHLVKRYGLTKVRGIVVGGATRLSTLRTVFSKLDDNPSVVVVHEASRPFVSANVIDETVKAAKRYGCSIAAHRLLDAVKVAPKGMKATTSIERNVAWAAQTPQAFKTDVLRKILASNIKSNQVLDDESALVKKPSEVHMVECGPTNIKIRTSDDLAIATALLNGKVV